MPAKSIPDLTPQMYVQCLSKPGGHWISILSEPTADGQVSPPKEMTIMVQAVNDLWRVVEVHADHGWGPFLYDIAMELATSNGDRLVCHENRVTSDAEAVWAFYNQHREDVTKVPLPEFCVAAVNAELRYSYQKTPTIIPELQRMGLWREVVQSL